MNPQIQTLPMTAETTSGNPFAELLAKEHKSVQSMPVVATGKRFVKVSEIKGEVEVEREIDFGYSVCAICLERRCGCQPRIEQRFTQRISYPVETTLATVIALQ